MTVQTTTSRADYTGNGVTTAFAVPFYFLDNTHVKVLRTQISTGVVTTLALTTDYTMTGAGVAAGGTVTALVAPTTDQKISILRNVPQTQLIHYVPNDPFPAATHEQALDQLTMEVQQVNEGLSRALVLPSNTPSGSVSATLPTPAANKLIAWNATADGLQNTDPSILATIVAFGTANADVFSGTGAQASFTLSANPGALNNLDVSIGGVSQRPSIDYTWTSGTTLTFTSAPPLGTSNILVRYLQGLPQGTSDSATSKFIQSGIGAISRIAQDKIRETVSVKDFGAIGDGIIDDTVAIQAAANSLTSGGRLWFPAGTYKVSSMIYLLDKTTIQGAGIGATTIQSTSANLTGVFQSWDSSQGNIYTKNVTRTYFGVFDMSIDMGHTLDRTSTVYSGGAFVQWNYGAACITAANTRDVVIENVRLSNAGYGISTGSNTNLIIRNVDIQGMQWDGIQTQYTQDILTVENARIYSTGRCGIISFTDKAQITIEKFSIVDCYCEGIEIEMQYDGAATKHPVVRNGFMYLCGTFVQIESYGITGFGTIDSVFMSTPLVATVAGAGFGSKTIGYADQYYNLNTGAGWTGTPSFPVPNTPGSWPNIQGSGVQGEYPTVVSNCVFTNMSTAAITNVTGPVYAYAFYEDTNASDITFENCRFVSSNVTAVNGEQRMFNSSYFINSLLTINQASGSFTNNPSTVISGNIFTGAGAGISLSDNAIITSNLFRNITGIAINVAVVPSDGRTTISNNEIVDARGGGSLMTHGVFCSFQNPSNCLIDNNYIYGATATSGYGASGIYVYDATASVGFVITNNRVEGCTYGIAINSGNGDVLQGNLCRSNTTADIRLTGGGASPAGAGIRIVNNILQSTVAVVGDSFTTYPGTCRFCNNEFTTLSPAILFSSTGTNVVQGNWS